MAGREHPILFGDELVRAILAGTKTQTRRPIKPQPDEDGLSRIIEPTIGPWQDTGERVYRCPFGGAGDTLWVRECWGVGTRPDPNEGWIDGIEYRADVALLEGEHDQLLLRRVETPDGVCLGDFASGRWRPSIHMPRWASRIVLDVIDVRVERVQDITDADASAEGTGLAKIQHARNPSRGPLVDAFANVWDRVYHGSWERNDWVWCVEFRRAA